MTRMMQNKEIFQKFQGICVEELLYTSDKFQVKAKDRTGILNRYRKIGQSVWNTHPGSYGMR